MKKVLIISAHPDDEVLGCGGFISKYTSAGVEFKVVFIGEGSTCRYENFESNDALNAINFRNNLAIDSLSLFNIKDIEFNNLPCGRFDQVPIITINKIIESAIRIFSPDTVLTHSQHDVNNDHKIVFNSTLMATRPGAQNHVKRVMSYEVLSSSEWAFNGGFMPNHFEQLKKADIDRKWQAIARYSSEIRDYPFPRSHAGVNALAMYRGMQSGFEYAESFRIIRSFEA